MEHYGNSAEYDDSLRPTSPCLLVKHSKSHEQHYYGHSGANLMLRQ